MHFYSLIFYFLLNSNENYLSSYFVFQQLINYLKQFPLHSLASQSLTYDWILFYLSLQILFMSFLRTPFSFSKLKFLHNFIKTILLFIHSFSSIMALFEYLSFVHSLIIKKNIYLTQKILQIYVNKYLCKMYLCKKNVFMQKVFM